MNINELLSSIDSESVRLQQARSLMARIQGGTTSERAKKPSKRRKMSAAARKRIAEAQKKRWAAIRVKKAAAAKRKKITASVKGSES
jgi:hypothetical protein